MKYINTMHILKTKNVKNIIKIWNYGNSIRGKKKSENGKLFSSPFI